MGGAGAVAGPAVVVAAYRPHPGRAEDLLALVRGHLPLLRGLGLVTDRPAILCRAKDGTLLEIFEWIDGDASSRAHHEPAVQELWEAMGKVAEFPAPSAVEEFGGRFPHFEPVS